MQVVVHSSAVNNDMLFGVAIEFFQYIEIVLRLDHNNIYFVVANLIEEIRAALHIKVNDGKLHFYGQVCCKCTLTNTAFGMCYIDYHRSLLSKDEYST